MMTRVRKSFPALFAWLLIAGDVAAERINQEGRILGPAPVVSTSTLFNTPGADAIVSALQIMPITIRGTKIFRSGRDWRIRMP